MRTLLLSVLLFLTACFSPSNKSSTPVVLVTIPPYADFVQQIAGDAVSIEIFVPPGANPHTYEPTPRQVERFAAAKIWFRYGDPIEQKVLPFLRERGVVNIDLSTGFRLLSSTDHACDSTHHHDGKDLHLWLNPRFAAKQAKIIAELLIKIWPEHRQIFENRSEELEKKLEALDDEIAQKLKPLKNSYLLLSHPALAYFCQRYGLHQISVECDGKDPVPQQVAYIVQEAQEKQVKVVFTEPQYNNKGAVLIAEKLNLPTYQIDPYAADYFKAMHQLTDAIVEFYGHQS